MDQATLVRSDLEIEGRVLEALSRASIPVTLCVWHFVPQLEEWQLVVATPWHDSKGPREAYSGVIRALQKAGIYEEVPIRRVFVLSPEDTLVKTLERDVKVRKEGAIHILAHPKANREKEFSVIFAPFAGPGGAVPAKHVASFGQLREFLERRIHIQKSSVDDTLAELARKGNASIFNVQLTNREAKRLGLA